MQDTLNTYFVFDADGATKCDTLSEAQETWAYTSEVVNGNVVNPAECWHVTDDCPARPMHGDFLEAAQDALDSESDGTYERPTSIQRVGLRIAQEAGVL